MRQRTISPGFFTNETITGLPCLARLAFAGLWLVADRAGRVEDRPRRVKVLLFPYEPLSDQDFDAILQTLHDAGFIRRYEVDGERYIQIENFLKHQHPHPKEKASVIPKPLASREKVEPSRVKDMSSKAGSSVPSGSSGSSNGVPASPARTTPDPPNSNGAGKATSTVLAKPSPPWSKEAAIDWDARFGLGSCNPGRIGKALSPLVKVHGWDRVRPAWVRYLREKEPEFITPQDFASKFGVWSGDAAPAQGKQTKGQELAAMAARFIARGEP